MIKEKLLYILIETIFLLIFSNAFATEKLIFSVDLIRHGDRTPLYQIPKSPYFWKEGLGELTTEGINQEIQLGKKLRNIYIHQYNLLPTFFNSETIYVRTTDKKRTILSAESLLRGLYPKKTAHLNQIPIHIMPNGEDKFLIVRPSGNFFSLGSRYLNNQNEWKVKTKDLKDKIKYWHEITGLPLNNFQQLDQLADNLYIRKLHQIPLPRGISNEDADKIISLNESEIVNEFKLKEISYPTGKTFLKMVVNHMNLVIQQRTHLKYLLLVGHDSSIMSVMNTLGSPINEIPGYASRLNFSFFKNNNNYYVKISFNGKSINLPRCNDSNVCTISQFVMLAS